ncbi:uncharacterized protein G2W53_026229 [Senna tora]|uniref:Uncharacterized protein n=1 Tax=Senna tora TaxID=362788 RepID=A0A834WL18_9FABA|nr:uncharacterized protein G2W53_026229 [Senna tora]
MLRRDPRSSHAKTTPIGASKPIRFASTTRTDVFDSLAQRDFASQFVKVSEIRPRFVARNMLRLDPRSSHAKTTPISASKPLRSGDHVLTYSGRQIVVGSQKPSRITRQKTCCASESNTAVRVVFANRSGFDAPIGVVLAREERGSFFSAWEERGSCLNIFRKTNRGRISEAVMNYEAQDLLHKSVDHVLTYSGQQIVVGSQKPSRITRILHELRGKRLVAQVSQTRRFALYLRTGVVLLLELETSWHGMSVDHVLTNSGQQIAVVSQKPSLIKRQKTYCASESNTSVRVVFANRSGFNAPIGVFLAWEECGSCPNIFRMTNRDRILEIFTNYEAKDLLRK